MSRRKRIIVSPHSLDRYAERFGCGDRQYIARRFQESVPLSHELGKSLGLTMRSEPNVTHWIHWEIGVVFVARESRRSVVVLTVLGAPGSYQPETATAKINRAVMARGGRL